MDGKEELVLLSALNAVVQALSTFLTLVVSFFSGLISLFALIPSCMVFLSLVWAVIPAPLWVFGSAALGIVLVLHILGR